MSDFKRLIIYIVLQTLVYSAVCITAWTWVLGFKFDIWKVFVTGLFQAFLLVICHIITQASKKENK